MSSSYPVMAVGYPICSNSATLRYGVSGSDKSNFDLIKRLVFEGEELIFTRGVILQQRDVMAITCGAINGMAGGPVLIESPSGIQVVGILFGGAASILHYYISRILRMENFAEKNIVREFYHQTLLKFDCSYGNPLLLTTLLNRILSTATITADETIELFEFLKYLYSSAIRIENHSGSFISYNNAISINILLLEIKPETDRY